MGDYPRFRPVLGTEEKILETSPSEGYLYFATDTKKIFYGDMRNKSFIPMGGNFGLYYGKLIHTEPPDEGQEEFDFTFDDLEEIDKVSAKIAPGDLILNTPDGSFYRVVSVEDELISTRRITISGSGGGGGTSSNVGKMTFERLGEQYITSIYQKDCLIGFKVSAVDAAGETTGDGSVKIEINSVEIEALRQRVQQNKEIWIDIGPYLPLGTDITVKVSVSMDVGGSSNVTQSKKWFVTTTAATLKWEFDERKAQDIENDFTLNWTVTGKNVEKNIEIIIDDYYSLPEMMGTNESWSYTISSNSLSSYNLNHGSHTFTMKASAKIGGQWIPVGTEKKHIIFKDSTNDLPIISCLLENKVYKQYNTIQVPVVVYSRYPGDTLYLLENGEEKGKNENSQNETLYEFGYTPSLSGTVILVLKYGDATLTLPLEIEDLGLGNIEPSGYAFKLKANEFTNNDAIQNWKIGVNNEIKLDFSKDFDWINGGLQTEKDELKNNRSFIRVKAGNTISLTYPLFKRNATQGYLGKLFKIIFRATNCRDYDAQVLSCKKNFKNIKIKNGEGEEYFFNINEETISYSSEIQIDAENNTYRLKDPSEAIFNVDDEKSRNTFNNKYILYNDNIYKCTFKNLESDKTKFYAEFYDTELVDDFFGLLMQAQQAIFNSRNSSLSTQYYEDSYIELELEITSDKDKIKNYIKFWIDGVPAGVKLYDSLDIFNDAEDNYITLGSKDCDVDIYLIKCYEKSLKDDEHINNFIIDSSNAEEMINRYHRNNILNETGEIDYSLLAQQNKDCLVHLYEIPKIPTTKNDETYPCSYKQLKGSDQFKCYADNVMIKVQGTSSEKYVVSAANLDTDFNYTQNNNVPSGLIDGETKEKLPGWKMTENSIPVDFICTKVNVASCENANNALNQEWYNLFQPYKSVLRCKNEKARDTMQFTNGVLFLKDNNSQYDLKAEAKTNNVFGDTEGYIEKPYYKFYSIANAGNSKDNIHVFHDSENPKECCIEVRDNQTPQQQMISNDYLDSDIDGGKKYYGFRFPEEPTQEMFDGWRRLITWMSHSNPQPKYNKYEEVLTEKDYENFAYDPKTRKWIETYILDETQSDYIKIEGFNQEYDTYYTKTEHVNGYDNLPLSDYKITTDFMPEAYKQYYIEQNGEYILYNALENGFYYDEEGINKTYELVEKTFGAYKFKGYIAEEQKDENGELWQKDYTPLVSQFKSSITQYQGTYTHDTYEYRMAKMLEECEHYLIMDSILYHYLFIERHCMIDNVAKNTFWSTEDCKHWNMIKDYDNDTSDGNDNQGKFTRTYGMEPQDKLNRNAYVFNAYPSVWLNFINGLNEACVQMYNQLDKKIMTYLGQRVKLFSAANYLQAFKKWQSIIPERCWIEDYKRKYLRPYEVYNDRMYIPMLEGGQKVHQRAQYENYQELYMDSKYNGSITNESNLIFRPNGTLQEDLYLPVQVYSDCYIRYSLGGQETSKRVKRNTVQTLKCPKGNYNNATFYFGPAKVYTVIGSTEQGQGQINDFFPEQLNFNSGKKLREIVFSTADRSGHIINEVFIDDEFVVNSPVLEKLYVANLPKYNQSLDLTSCPSLQVLDARNSLFSSVQIADKASLEDLKLQSPSALQLSNLYNLKILDINDFTRLSILDIHNIDNNDWINSKTNILDSCLDYLTNYRLSEIKWTLSGTDVINQQKEIVILKRLLEDKKPLMNNESSSGFNSLDISLTGTITVDESAYNGKDSIDIYNKYVTPEKYPNLDINFTGENAKLYNVKVLNGDEKVYWQKKISKEANVDSTFLSSGPNGAFNINKIQKTQTLEHKYEFKNEWIIITYDSEGNKIETSLSNSLPILNSVNSDVIFIPLFNELPATYMVEFFDANSQPNGTYEVQYPTTISEIYPTQVPYKNEANLQLYQKYHFKGYGLSPLSKGVLPDNYIIVQDSKFYAIFDDQPQSVYSSTVNPLYLEADSNNRLKVKSGYTLTGKVTLPKEFNGKPVKGIQSSGFQNQKVTHVFWEQGSTEEITVEQYAFQRVDSLQYYEITDNLTSIGDQAFAEVNFNGEMTTIKGDKLTTIGSSSFYKSFQNYFYGEFNEDGESVRPPWILKIGGNIRKIGTLAFAYNIYSNTKINPAIIQFGDRDNPWVDDISSIYSDLGNNLFAESEDTNSVYNFTIVSRDYSSSSDWAKDNAEKFQAKLGIRSSSTINYV